jgi:outer membrane protein, multidrug efflux system
MTGNRFIIGAAVLYLAGCSFIPHYTRPETPVPAQWPSGPAYKADTREAEGEPATVLPWRDFYTDERLQKVVDLALQNNRDLRIATSAIERARAVYQIQRSELFPIVGTAGVVTEQRIPANGSMTGEAYSFQQYSVNLGMTSWELDFFGRIRSLKERSLDQFLATEQAQRSVQISLIADVANLYLIRAADGEGLKLAQSTLEARETTYRMVQKRFDVGASSSLDLRQAETVLHSARVDVARYTRLVAVDENALNLFVGSPVPPELLVGELADIKPLREVTPGLSSNVLLARPDVLQFENLLKAANANIGAARAAFFPRIALTTNVGTTSPELSGLFRAGSGAWLFAPQITLPIFDTGARRANLKVAETDRDIYTAQYEKTIQVAFREMADALAVRGTICEQISAQEALVDAAMDTYRLSNARYMKGIDNYLVVLDAQRSLYAAQQTLITLRLASLSNLVTLHKVLGGGAA